jgi:hypothetical protein
MRKVFAWLGLVTLAGLAGLRTAEAGEPLKPYVVFLLDSSRSMERLQNGDPSTTGFGPPSCGGPDTRLNHARCAINKIVNSYGDMTFALGRYPRQTMGGTSGTTFPSGCTLTNPGCRGKDDDQFELLSPLVEGGNDAAAKWTDQTGNTCGYPTTYPIPSTQDPEIWSVSDDGSTPMTGAIVGTQRYYQGKQSLPDGSVTTLWPFGLLGFSPINADPLRNAFLPKITANATTCNSNPVTCDATAGCTGTNCCCARQCRPYLVIVVTDDVETCALPSDAVAAAAGLLSTPFPVSDSGAELAGYKNYRIETKAIGFAITPPTTDCVGTSGCQIEDLAHAGGAPDLPGTREGYYANNEAQLQLAITSILDDAIRTETCNNADDDCDNSIDEDFPGKASTCNNGRLGKCRVNGANACRTDGTGVGCTWSSTPTCAVAGAGCNVVNASGNTVAGTCTSSPAGLRCEPTAAANEGTQCNQVDDDCDGVVDEGLTCNCIPTGEQCDGINNDCDGAIDEGLTRSCGTGVCTGTETCVNGEWTGCNAPPVGVESCNGLDDDCDGNRDGFNRACSNMTCPGGSCVGGTCTGGARAGKQCGGFATDDPRNNPGGLPGSACMALGTQCVCHPGAQTCPLNGTPPYGYSACAGEVEPGIEVCNNLDDDCDGEVDEQPTITCTHDSDCAGSPITPVCENPTGAPNAGTCQNADCSVNNCGGRLICGPNGVPMCTQSSGVDNSCNGIDEDCDGMFDEHWQCTDPDGPDDIPGNADDCPCTSGGMCNAHETCENGAVICAGTPTSIESCDCEDDDCDGAVDEGTCGAGGGPAGSSCKGCQCAFPCQGGEFPCPLGKRCVTQPGDTQGFCLADPCFGVTCDAVNGNMQVCRPKANNPSDHECISACDPSVITCNAPNICFGPTGECRPDDCTTFPDRCSAQQLCVNGNCVTNLCLGVDCPDDQYCVSGQCYESCANIECPSGQRCRLGACVTDPCGEPCPNGQVCHDATGECVADPCGVINCPQGQWCNPNNNGMCEDDPCVGTACPHEGEICRGGTCFDPSAFAPDAPTEQHVTTGGGGGCSTGGGSSGAGLALGLAVMLMLVRRTKGGAS